MFKDWLRSQLSEKDLTQKIVADAVGVEQQAVSRWLKGPSRPGSIRISRLARVLDVPVQTVIDELEADEGAALPIDLPAPSLEEEVAELRKRVAELEQYRQRPRRSQGS